MDEIFGYFPPHPANPPTKRPLLTLLKQARAQGVGVVLATQNPVDLDYKGLANMGTWMVGTLQTQQDRERLSGGLQGAGLEPKAVEKLLAGDEEAGLPPPRRPPPGAVPPAVALGDVLPARAAHAGGDLAAHEGEARRRGRARRAEGGVGPGRPARPAAALPPPLPRRGGRARSPTAHLLVKYAVRYKGVDEAVGVRGVAALGRDAGRHARVRAHRGGRGVRERRRARGPALPRPAGVARLRGGQGDREGAEAKGSTTSSR